MAKILEFRTLPPQPPTAAERAAEVLNSKQATDLIVLDFCQAALPRWIENEWPFGHLELMCNDLRTTMEANVPEGVTREQVEWTVKKLHPTWDSLIRELDSSLFW